MPVLSGSSNAGRPFEVRAERPASEGSYAALVRLVKRAQTQRAPFMRMADRYAGFFLPATLVLAGLAWGLSGDPVRGAGGGGGGGDALSVDPGRADRPCLRRLARRPERRDREGRGHDRGPGRRPHGSVRQDAGEVRSATATLNTGSGQAHVLVAVDGHVAGVIVVADELRSDASQLLPRLRAEGVLHVAILSGDRRAVAEQVGAELGVDRVYAELSAEDKLDVVRRVADDRQLKTVIMVGDGINDAPALAIADVGIAMGAGGATVSSETADAVITVDRVDRVADALHAGRRALSIARQSVLAGMGVSLVTMVVAAAGYLPPVAGALFQEAIDLAVILNALRALRG